MLLVLPGSVLATFALAPLWRGVETGFAIESIGHSGPATWCFVAVAGAAVGGVLALRAAARRH